MPRSSHAEWTPAADRPDPVAPPRGADDEPGAGARAHPPRPDDAPRRSRSTAALPRSWHRTSPRTPRSGIRAQLCGDAHLSNFGAFGSPERKFLFDLNDFDETLPGPWEWDVKRLAASFAVAGRHRGVSRQALSRAGRRSRSRRTARRCCRFAGMSEQEVWYTNVDAGELVRAVRRAGDAQAGQTASEDRPEGAPEGQHARVREAHRRRRRERRGSSPTIHSSCPIEDLLHGRRGGPGRRLGPRIGSRATARPSRTTTASCSTATSYAHLARKVVGVGSVGTRAWVVLFIGRDMNEPLFLQVQGGAAVGARAVRRQERVRQHGPAGRRRAAADAGRERHLPRLAAGDQARRRGARLLRAPAVGLEGIGGPRADPGRQLRHLRAAVRRGRSPARTRARATGWPSRRTSAAATRSIARSRRSPSRTPTRTSATTRRSSTPCEPGGSPRCETCSAELSAGAARQIGVRSRLHHAGLAVGVLMVAAGCLGGSTGGSPAQSSQKPETRVEITYFGAVHRSCPPRSQCGLTVAPAIGDLPRGVAMHASGSERSPDPLPGRDAAEASTATPSPEDTMRRHPGAPG